MREEQKGPSHYIIDIPLPLTGLAALLQHTPASAWATKVQGGVTVWLWGGSVWCADLDEPLHVATTALRTESVDP